MQTLTTDKADVHFFDEKKECREEAFYILIHKRKEEEVKWECDKGGVEMSDHMGPKKALDCEQFKKTYLAVISTC